MRAIIFGAVLASIVGTAPAHAFGHKRSVPVDSVTAVLPSGDASTSGDLTGIVEGCGNQPIVGYTYCRMVEGDAADQSISFIGPPADCNGADGKPADSCVYIQVLNQAGQGPIGVSIPKGQTRVSIPWKTLLGTDKFEIEHRGYWPFVIEVHWRDKDGHDRISRARGEIRLQVYKAGYTPLDKVSGDPNFAWIWVDAGHIYKMTSGLRAYVGHQP